MPTEEEKFQIDDCRIVLGNGGLVVGNYKSDHNNPCKGSKMTTGDNLVKVINMEVQHELLFTGELADQIEGSSGCCTITALITDINSKITLNSGDLDKETARATDAEDQITKDREAAEAKITEDREAAEAKITVDLDKETARAMAAEDQITKDREAAEAKITEDREAAEAKITDDLKNEKARAIEAEAKITDDLKNEKARATEAEAGLDGRITNILSNVDPTALDSLSEIVGEFQNADTDLQNAITTIASELKEDLKSEKARATDAEAKITEDLKAAEAKITTSASDNSRPFVGYSGLEPNTPVKIIQDYTKYLKLVQISDTEIATLCLRDNEGVPLDGIKYGDYESKCIHYISGPNKNN